MQTGNTLSMRGCLRARLGLLLLACVSQAGAVALGPITVHSPLGRPLEASIALDPSPYPLDGLSVRVASPAGAVYSPFAEQVSASLDGSGGTSRVRLATRQLMTEPALELLVELRWHRGEVGRVYTLLFDPPKPSVSPVAAGRETPSVEGPPAAPARSGAAPTTRAAALRLLAPERSELASVPAPLRHRLARVRKRNAALRRQNEALRSRLAELERQVAFVAGQVLAAPVAAAPRTISTAAMELDRVNTAGMVRTVPNHRGTPANLTAAPSEEIDQAWWVTAGAGAVSVIALTALAAYYWWSRRDELA